MEPTEVAVAVADRDGYPSEAPFAPDQHYPESMFGTGREPNSVYATVREVFRLAGLDRENYGSSAWSPLKTLIAPGSTVLLKPNLIKERHPQFPDGWQWVLTHGSVIRAVADFVWKALEGRGTIVLADAPQTDSSFELVVRTLGLDTLADFYRSQGLEFQLLDLRREEWANEGGVITERRTLPGDPRGSIAFDLGSASEFEGHDGGGRYYGADYDAGVVNNHHTDGRHEYQISGSAIQADVVFNLPKWKTHKKAGLTASLKNLVGVNGDKNWLPHYTEARFRRAGDEHPDPDWKHRIERLGAAALRRLSLRFPTVGTQIHQRARRVGTDIFGDTEDVVRSGNWWGNDTVWRMCLDLNKLVFYGDEDGTLRPPGPEHRKRHLVLLDGIIAGQGSGPLNPDPVHARVVMFGIHPASVDAAAACLMGFDPERMPIVRQAFRCRDYPLCEWGWRAIRLASNRSDWNDRFLTEIAVDDTLRFEPHFGWTGHIERASSLAASGV